MATANIDISADRCLAYFWHFMAYVSNKRAEMDHGSILRMQVKVPGSHSMYTVAPARMPFPGVDNRVFPARWAWRREKNETFVLGFTFKGKRQRLQRHQRGTSPPPPPSLALTHLSRAGSNEHVERAIREDERAAGCTRGTTQGFWRFKPLAPNVCSATLVFQAVMGGRIPVMAMNYGVKAALAFAESFRNSFERNGKAVDAELRRALPPPPSMETLNEEQAGVAQRCLALETESAAEIAALVRSSKNLVTYRGSAAAQARAAKGSWVKLKSTSPFVSLSMMYTEPEGLKQRYASSPTPTSPAPVRPSTCATSPAAGWVRGSPPDRPLHARFRRRERVRERRGSGCASEATNQPLGASNSHMRLNWRRLPPPLPFLPPPRPNR
jgi:hypothetical protein